MENKSTIKLNRVGHNPPPTDTNPPQVSQQTAALGSMPSLLRQRPVFPVLILLLQSSVIVSFTSLDQQHQPRPTAYTYTERCSSVSSVVLFANPSGSDDGNKKSGYRFGDITKSLIGKRVEKVRASFCVNASQSTHVNTTITFTFHVYHCAIKPLTDHRQTLRIR